MAWRSRLTRSNLRSLAGLFVLTLLGGLIVDTPHAAASQQAFDNLLNYSCEFIGGPQPVSVRIQGRLPLRVTADSAIQPEQVQVSVNIAPTVLKGLTGLGSGPITGSVQFNAKVTQGKRTGIVKWPKFPAAPAKPDSSQGLTLAAGGYVPPINGAQPNSGPLSVAADTFVLSMAPAQGTKAQIASGMKSMLCQPAEQKNATLGKVAVAKRVTPNAAAASPTECPSPIPTALNPGLPSATPSPDDTVVTNPVVPTLCARADGTSNAAKLHEGAQVTGVATVRFPDITVRPIDTSNPLVRADAPAALNFQPTRGTFLGFGFMPVSAKVTLVPLGTANGVFHESTLLSFPPPTQTTDIYAKVDLKLSDASVNGVKLNLGARCRITKPIFLHLQGTSDSDPPYIVDQSGGPLTGTFTIPAFTGCGVGDNLDPILNATVAGPNNFARAYQGFPCDYAEITERCPPRPVGIQVSPGGKWSGSGAPVQVQVSGEIPFFEYNCGLAASGSFKPGRNFWFGIGSLEKFDLSGCTLDPTLPSPFGEPSSLTVDSGSLPWAMDVSTVHERGPDVEWGHIRYGRVVFTAPGCKVVFSSKNQNSTTWWSDASLWEYLYYEGTGALDFSNMNMTVESVEDCVVDGAPQFVLGDPGLNNISVTPGTAVVNTSPLQKFSL